jgi:hypothetical protein
MADQAKERPQRPDPAAHAGEDVLRLYQDAIPLPSMDSDALTEAARHFRELQAKSVGLTEINMPARASRGPALPAGMPSAEMPPESDGAAARVTPRISLRSATMPETVFHEDLAGDAKIGLPTPPTGAPSALTTKDIQPSALSSLVADIRPSARAPSSHGNAASSPDSGAATPSSQDGPIDDMKRAAALAAGAPILAPSIAAGGPPAPQGSGSDAMAKQLPALDRKRPIPTAPSSNLRLYAGLSVIIAAFAGSLIWVAMWRADSFNGKAEATLDVSPEDLLQTAAGSNGTGDGNGGGNGGGSVTATLMVRDTELLLAKLAFDPGPADGVLDDTTRNAIKHYQQVAGLPETGEPSKELLEELQAVAGAIDGH